MAFWWSLSTRSFCLLTAMVFSTECDNSIVMTLQIAEKAMIAHLKLLPPSYLIVQGIVATKMSFASTAILGFTSLSKAFPTAQNLRTRGLPDQGRSLRSFPILNFFATL